MNIFFKDLNILKEKEPFCVNSNQKILKSWFLVFVYDYVEIFPGKLIM